MYQNYDPTNAIVYSNRATAFKKHKQFQLQFEDSQRAAELDKKYFKGFLRNGEAAVELGKGPVHQDTKLIDQGIEQLQRALYLCWNMDEGDKNYYHKDSYAKEIGKQIYRAKKIRWFKQKDLEKA